MPALDITDDQLAGLAEVADVLAFSPQLRAVLGGNINASVAPSPSGRGLVFTFEKVEV